MALLTSKNCLQKFGMPGLPNQGKYMILWNLPADINAAIPNLPDSIYTNRLMVAPLEAAFRNLITRGLASQLHSFDGSYSVRLKRGQATPSLHSWGCAVDINASTNPFGKKGTMTPEMVQCFKDAGLDWGGEWKRPDGMHFQLRTL